MTDALLSLLSAVPYPGRADRVWPPFVEGWAEVPFHHDTAVVGRANALLGALPTYHYADEALPSGLYRFFAYETPVGTAVSALKFIGADRARALMGDSSSFADYVDTVGTADGGVVAAVDGSAIPEDNSQITGDGTGNAGVKVTPVAYATVQAAATAMNAALAAHGYVRTDQPIYAGFQIKANLTVDAFPGTNTMAALKSTLQGMGATMTNVPIYPWLATAAGGATGTAAYDGTNAPTWAQWTGQGSAPSTPSASSSSSSSTGLAVAALAALAVGGLALVAKTSGGLAALV